MFMAKGEALIRCVRAPGWKRRVTIAIIVAVIVAISVGIAERPDPEGISAALAIFAASLIGFSLVAAVSHDAVLCWRFVDFFWICSSFAAVVVALVNVDEAIGREQISNARSELTDLFSGLVFAAQSIITTDCEEPSSDDVRPRSAEPYRGACDQLKHLIPELLYEYDQFAHSNSVASLRLRVKDVLVSGAPVGAWANLNDRVNRFVETCDRLDPILGMKGKRDPLHRFVVGTQVKYWYFFMAFFVGLRLSRTTAEILQVGASRALSASRPPIHATGDMPDHKSSWQLR
jgi:hypothetical protein